MNKYLNTAPTWLRALGARQLPSFIRVEGRVYHHVVTFKHDFFAATGLYEGDSGRVVLKIGRTAPLAGLPLFWIGKLLCKHESRMINFVKGVPGVPRFVGNWNATGLVHEYVEGRPLAKEDRVDDEFFPRLSQIIAEIHHRSAAYVDLEKRENIIHGTDGRPYLIDFQISWHIPSNRGGDGWFLAAIRRVLQESDYYHLHKHWRRLRPDQYAALGLSGSRQPPVWIRWHRLIFRPLTLVRRQILVWLRARTSIHARSPG